MSRQLASAICTNVHNQDTAAGQCKMRCKRVSAHQHSSRTPAARLSPRNFVAARALLAAAVAFIRRTVNRSRGLYCLNFPLPPEAVQLLLQAAACCCFFGSSCRS